MKNLSAYELQCGSVQRQENKRKWKELYYETLYHVRAGYTDTKWKVWTSYYTIREARKAYNSIDMNSEFLSITK